MRKIMIAGNWKMNLTKAEGIALAEAVNSYASSFPNVEILMCPPMSLVGLIGQKNLPVALGAQDIAETPKSFGAFTGDVSAEMVKDLGATYTILGHSERRAMHHETDAIVSQKASNAHQISLKTIICVGETLEEREAGKALEIVTNQVKGSLPTSSTAENTVIAYEPVWAIGTGKIPTLDEIAEVHHAIREKVADLFGQETAQGMRILYGGSVKPSNAKDILALEDVDGALVGGASLKPDDFKGIISAV